MKKTGKMLHKIILIAMFLLITVCGMPGKTQSVHAAATLTRSAVVEYAKSYVGKVPYVWGGNSFKTGMDCSGFVCGVYEHFGLDLWAYRTKIRNSPLVEQKAADLSLAEPGDILWFEGHVGIYTGKVNGTHYMVNETTGTYKGITDNVIYSPVSICSAKLKGVLKVKALQGTSASSTYYAAAKGTDGSLAINDKAASSPKYSTKIGQIPEGAVCTVYSDKTSGKWIWVKYGSVQGWAYSTYLTKVSKTLSDAVESTHPHKKYNKYSNGYVEWLGVAATYNTSTIAPTCTEKGYTLKKCTQCSYSEKSNEKAALGHNTVTDQAVAATCGKSGKTAGSHCSRCGKVFKAQQTIAATGKHDYDSGKITKEPTVSSTGVKTYTCKNCGKTKTETLPKQKIEVTGGSSTTTGSSSTTGGSNTTTGSSSTTGSSTTMGSSSTTGGSSTTTGSSSTTGGSSTTTGSTAGTSNSLQLVQTVKKDNYSVKIAKTCVTANGKLQKPKITVKYKGKTVKAKYYTVKYTSNKYTGLATATVKGKGTYASKIPTTKLRFVITPKKMTISTAKATTGKVTLGWKAEKNATEYQLQISTNKSFKSGVYQWNLRPTLKKVNVFGLTSKKTHYMRLRACKTIQGVTYYGKWSTVKKVKTK